VRRHKNLHLVVACQEPVVTLHVMHHDVMTSGGAVSYDAGVYHVNVALTRNAVLATDCPESKRYSVSIS